MAATTVFAALLLGSALQPGGAQMQDGAQRIYFEAWNVGTACGTDAVPGCREAAIGYLTGPDNGYNPAGAAILAVFGLLTNGGDAVDLTQGLGSLTNFSQFGGVCRSDAVSLSFRPGFEVLAKATGCLTPPGLVPGNTTQAFAVAFVKPPAVDGMAGGQVKGCPDGFCVLAVDAPDGVAITLGSDKVAQVCGESRHVCTIAVGDFNTSPAQTYVQRWVQLVGSGPAGAPKLYKTGAAEHAIVLTNLDAGGAMNVGQGYPLEKKFPNVTGMRQAGLIDLLVPCQHPGPFPSDGCTA